MINFLFLSYQPNANVQDETLTITMIGRSQDLLRAFVTEAMSLAMKREKVCGEFFFFFLLLIV